MNAATVGAGGFVEASTGRFADEGIVIPFASRAIDPAQEAAHKVDKTE